jgi:hypothetical protein
LSPFAKARHVATSLAILLSKRSSAVVHGASESRLTLTETNPSRSRVMRDPNGENGIESRISARLQPANAEGAPTGEMVDDDLPGMWAYSDFMGGDPDERSHHERAGAKIE